MLPSCTECSRCPQPLQESVLVCTAKALGLSYANRELLRLDAIFSHDEEWFPVVVAIEHENDPRQFISEITKLLSVRCPLKVGITYTYGARGRESAKLNEIKTLIAAKFAEISGLVAEDGKTEYLFLVGVETYDQPKDISHWYSLDFRALSGPVDRGFELLSRD